MICSPCRMWEMRDLHDDYIWRKCVHLQLLAEYLEQLVLWMHMHRGMQDVVNVVGGTSSELFTLQVQKASTW